MLQHSKAVDDTEAERLHGVAEAGSLAFASAPSHTTTSVDVSWLNLVLGRWFDEYGTHSELLATLAWKLERMVQAKAVEVKVIDSVSITNLVLGSHPPRVSDLALHPTLQPHELVRAVRTMDTALSMCKRGYATELIVPIVRDAIASAKHMTHRGDTTVVSSQSVDDLVHLAKHSKHHIDGAVEGVPSPQVDATKGVVNSCLPAESAAKDAAVVSPKTSAVDVALLVSLAKAKKSN
ncbi:hypothetical protein DYB32_002661 [Aphanomyces invadans]|uniref:Uncharacterized protein n=1 Tax=Aphanomyces invadans TaxID=157072 RepID=A0A418B2T6_9STRA|nr:hypothetical protein DYB32_002661 [Aphanomyces invadans]